MYIKEKTLEPFDLELAQTYKNIGVFYYNNKIKLNTSGIYLKKALDIYSNNQKQNDQQCY